MDIDLSILRMLEREKEISFDVLVEAIEQALLTAYHKTPGAQENARVVLDRRSGHVTVFAAEVDDEGNRGREYDDTPDGFGRIAATTAKQIMLQRLRDAEDDIRFGEFSGKEGDIVSGVIQQGRNPDDVMVDLGKLEALLPMGERAPGERYEHGARIKCLVISVRKGMRGPQITLSRSHPNLVQQAVRPRGARDRQRHRRDRRHRPRGRAPHQDRGPLDPVRRQRQGRLHRPDGPTGAQRDGRAARREDRHRRLVRRPRRDGRPRPLTGPGQLGRPSSTPRPGRPGSSSPTSSCRWPSARRARTPASPPG